MAARVWPIFQHSEALGACFCVAEKASDLQDALLYCGYDLLLQDT
jgi:hypothetical protein